MASRLSGGFDPLRNFPNERAVTDRVERRQLAKSVPVAREFWQPARHSLAIPKVGIAERSA